MTQHVPAFVQTAQNPFGATPHRYPKKRPTRYRGSQQNVQFNPSSNNQKTTDENNPACHHCWWQTWKEPFPNRFNEYYYRNPELCNHGTFNLFYVLPHLFKLAVLMNFRRRSICWIRGYFAWPPQRNPPISHRALHHDRFAQATM